MGHVEGIQYIALALSCIWDKETSAGAFSTRALWLSGVASRDLNDATHRTACFELGHWVTIELEVFPLDHSLVIAISMDVDSAAKRSVYMAALVALSVGMHAFDARPSKSRLWRPKLEGKEVLTRHNRSRDD